MNHKRTIDHDRRKLEWLQPLLGQKRLVEIDRFVIADIGKLKAEQASPATANRYLALIRAILRRAVFEWEWLTKPPRIHLYKEPSRRIRWLTADQVRTLLDELLPHQRDAVLFALATGLRHANVAGLKWEQIDMTRRTAWLFADQVKNGEEWGRTTRELERHRARCPQAQTGKTQGLRFHLQKSPYQAI